MWQTFIASVLRMMHFFNILKLLLGGKVDVCVVFAGQLYGVWDRLFP